MGCSRPQVDARPIQIVPALSDIIRHKAAYTQGSVNDHNIDILLDSGASCSVIHKDFVTPQEMKLATPMKLINADGRNISPVGTAT